MIALLLATTLAALDTQAAMAAIHACADKGQMVSAAVAGPEGELRVLIRGDGSPPHSIESARRKAYTAASFGQPTEELASLVIAHPNAAGLQSLDNVLFIGGGLPLIVNGKSVGAIGVAGGNGPGIDEGCARAGLAVLEQKP